jgi:hypothetical protein
VPALFLATTNREIAKGGRRIAKMRNGDPSSRNPFSQSAFRNSQSFWVAPAIPNSLVGDAVMVNHKGP